MQQIIKTKKLFCCGFYFSQVAEQFMAPTRIDTRAETDKYTDAGRVRKKYCTLSELITNPQHDTYDTNRESKAQFENQVKPRGYVRRIMRSTMYETLHFVTWNWRT